MDNQVLCGCCLSACSGPYHDVPHSTFIVEIDKRVCVCLCVHHIKNIECMCIFYNFCPKNHQCPPCIYSEMYILQIKHQMMKKIPSSCPVGCFCFSFFLLYFRKWTNTKNLFYKHVSRKKYTYGHEVQCC